MITPYKPRGDSVPARVLKFFGTNPDEELTQEDIASKYGVPRASVHTVLARAVEAGLLARSESSGEWLYSKGDGDTQETSAKPAPTSALDRAWTPPMVRAPQNFIAIDPAAVPLEDDVPVPVMRVGAVTDWATLLDRMRPGHSAVLPAPKRAAVSRACKEAKKAGRGRFLMKASPEDETFRIWRLE